MKRAAAFGLALALLGGCVTARPVTTGQPFDVAVPKLDGGAFSFASLKGRVVLVDVWASWCRPCVQSLPFYADLQNALKDKGFTFVGINVDEDARAATEFLRDAGLDLVTLHDPGAAIVASRLGIARMPTAFFLDREGHVRHMHEGFQASDEAAFRQRLEALLAEPEAAPAAPAR